MKKIGKTAVNVLNIEKSMLLERSEMKKILGGRLFYCKCARASGHGNDLYDFYYDYDYENWDEILAQASYDCYNAIGISGATCTKQ